MKLKPVSVKDNYSDSFFVSKLFPRKMCCCVSYLKRLLTGPGELFIIGVENGK